MQPLKQSGGRTGKRIGVNVPEDEAAVDEVLAGNVAAFEILVRRWQRPLVNLAYRFCRDRGRAEEMAQEAFIRAYRSLAQWRRESSFSNWLFAVATNLYRSEVRRIPINIVALDDVVEPGDPQSLGGTIEAGDTARAVRRAVDALPPKYREPLILFYFHEKDIAATAQSLTLPEGTIKARLSRARELLSRKLSRLRPETQKEDAFDTQR